MASVKENTTIQEYQKFVQEVYGLSNDRNFSIWDMISNVQRFTMRALKGIRKGDEEKVKINLLITLSWFTSIMNQFHIDIASEAWKRFPYMCSYCASLPCVCKEKKVQIRQIAVVDEQKQPKTLKEFQQMFTEIYPPGKRTLEDAGIHLAEELGEISEAVFKYLGLHKSEDFSNIPLEAADFLSCLLGVFSSMEVDIAKELAEVFSNNCHICKKSPCECDFKYVAEFES